MSGDVRLRLAILAGIAFAFFLLWLALYQGKVLYALLLGGFTSACILGHWGLYRTWTHVLRHGSRREQRNVRIAITIFVVLVVALAFVAIFSR